MTLEGEQALDMLLLTIAPPAPDAWLLVESRVNDRWLPAWCPVDQARFSDLVGRVAGRWETRVSLTAHRGRDHSALHGTTVLWAVVDTGKGVEILGRLWPRPTLVLQEGDTVRRTALWALDRPLTWDWVVKANRRLAHQLQAPKKFAEPTHSVQPPGTFRRDGRLVPLPIVVAERNPNAIYTPKQVVGHLRDAPSPEAWRARQEATA